MFLLASKFNCYTISYQSLHTTNLTITEFRNFGISPCIIGKNGELVSSWGEEWPIYFFRLYILQNRYTHLYQMTIQILQMPNYRLKVIAKAFQYPSLSRGRSQCLSARSRGLSKRRTLPSLLTKHYNVIGIGLFRVLQIITTTLEPNMENSPKIITIGQRM